MCLIKVERLQVDEEGKALPKREAVIINTDDVVAVTPTLQSQGGDYSLITFRYQYQACDGMLVVGKPEDLYEAWSSGQGERHDRPCRS